MFIKGTKYSEVLKPVFSLNHTQRVMLVFGSARWYALNEINSAENDAGVDPDFSIQLSSF